MKKRLSQIVLLMMPLVLCGCQASLFKGLNLASSSDGIRLTPAQLYSAEHGLTLDVYQPEHADSLLPVLVFFYGGTWSTGNKEWYAWAARELARRGTVVIIPDYRQAPRHRFPAFMDDSAQAVDWAIANAKTFNGDPGKLFLGGHSAGAHIAVLLSSDSRYLEQVDRSIDDLAGVIGLAGPYDFLPIEGSKLRGVFGSDSQTHQRSQPIRYVHAGQPPMLLLHGADDSTVLPRNSRRMAERLKAADVEVEFELLPDLGHVALLLALRSSDPHQVHQRIRDFIEKHSLTAS